MTESSHHWFGNTYANGHCMPNHIDKTWQEREDIQSGRNDGRKFWHWIKSRKVTIGSASCKDTAI